MKELAKSLAKRLKFNGQIATKVGEVTEEKFEILLGRREDHDWGGRAGNPGQGWRDVIDESYPVITIVINRTTNGCFDIEVASGTESSSARNLPENELAETAYTSVRAVYDEVMLP